jgi:hypothetical protein
VTGNGVNEFSSLVAELVKAAQGAAGNSEGVDVTDLITEWSPKIAAARDASVAAALLAQADFYWEASTLLDPVKAVAELNGEESMSAVIDAQIRTMREVSARLRRRAMQWKGLPPEDQAIHEMLAGGPPKSAAATALGVVGLPGLADDLANTYFGEHPELDKKTTSLEFRQGEKGWYIAGHMEMKAPPGFAMPPAPPDCDCACCLVGDGKCYCNNSGKPKTKWCKCVPCKTARDEGRTAEEG